MWAAVAAAATVGAVVLVGPQASAAQPQKGPDPTEQLVKSQTGPFDIARTSVPAGSGRGFNKGTLYYPTDTSQGAYAAVAVIPGFFEGEYTQSWFGPALASHGFVVFTLETHGLFDFPDQRGDQLIAALDWLVASSPVKDRVDPARLAVMGHSMGGGGTLAAANKRPSIKAAVALTPWHMTKRFPGIEAATMIIGAQSDSIASVSGHAEPMYAALTSPDEHAYVELTGGHFVTNSYTATNMRFILPWLKRFLDSDTRYSPFVCPGPAQDSTFVEYRNTCPV
ncbi:MULTISPECIES: alpha/beta hydrolase family protein [Actinokineospora]|uniref:Lipase n=1 Tax=Actinokineospora fastidiosa TaxID=1816 RepID=A0A918GHB6_9PSEU|nr:MULTISPECIES: prolyl oligopeptidase family serine peptidase [Actinokineospora]GGS36559.1 lipase [Actinokineospora fastidiosa]